MRTYVQPARETIDAMTMVLDVLETQPSYYTEMADPCYEIDQLFRLVNGPMIRNLCNIPAYIIDIWTILVNQAYPGLDDASAVAFELYRSCGKHEVTTLTRFLMTCVIQRRTAGTREQC